MSDATAAPSFELQEDGKIIHNRKGKQIHLATYNEEEKSLEFESAEYATKYRAQITQAIGTNGEGTIVSDRKISSMSIKGQEMSSPKKGAPKKPPMHKMQGDTTPEVVEWFIEWWPEQAEVLYGIHKNPNGSWKRADVQRKVTALVDDRDGFQNFAADERSDGPKSSIKGDVGLETTVETLKKQIIANRATHMTFLPSEIVGAKGEDEGMFEGGDE